MLDFAQLTGAKFAAALDDVARLRLSVFRAFPYLYDGTLDYERDYLARFAAAEGAVIIAAYDGARMVGAATGCPLAAEHAAFTRPFTDRGMDVARIFYCAESVLEPGWRGQGAGHRFFDMREAQGRRLGATQVAFCAVVRPVDHPARPVDYAPLEPFWRRRGYAPVPGLVAQFSWQDLGGAGESEKPMQFWMKDL